jgi:phage-related protein
MAVSLEAVFNLIDRASGPLRTIQRNAMLTDKALGSMGKNRQLSMLSDSFGKVGWSSKQMRGEVEKTRWTVQWLGKELDRDALKFKNIKNHIENFTRSLVQSHPAIQGAAQGLGGLGGAVKGFATALPMMGTLIITAIPIILQLAGAIGAVSTSLIGAAGGGALLGGGLLGAFGVGLGSVAVLAKPAITQLTNYQKAVTNLNKAIASGKPGQIKAAQLNVDRLAKANPGVAGLAQNIAKFKKEWDKATAPGKASFLKLANEGIALLVKNTQWLAKEVDKNMAAVERAIRTHMGPLVKALKPLIGGLGGVFRANIGGAVGGVVDLLKGLGNILKVIAPTLDKAGGAFQRMAKAFESWTGSAHGRQTVKNMTDAFKEWARLLGGIARIIGDVIGAGMQTGTGVVKKWADSVTAVANMLAKPGGTKGIESWFKRTMDQAGKLMPVLKTIASSMLQLYQIWKPLGAVTQAVLKAVPSWMLTVGALGFIGGKAVAGAAGPVKAIGKAFGKFKDKGDRPTDPLFVAVVGETGKTTSGLFGGGKFSERLSKWEEKGGWRGKLAGGLRKVGIGRAAEEAEQLAIPGLEAAAGVTAAGAAGKGGLLSKVGGFFSKIGGKLGLSGLFKGGGGIEGEIGRLAKVGGHFGRFGGVAALGVPLLESMIPSKVMGSTVGKIAGSTLSGAGFGAILGPEGAAVGAGLGAAYGGAKALGLDPGKLGGLAKKGFTAVKGAAGDAWKWIKGHWDWLGILAGPLGLATTMIIKHFGAIKKAIGAAWNWIKRAATNAAKWIVDAFSNAWKWIKNAATNVAKWVSGAFTNAWNWIKTGVSNAAKWIVGAFNNAWNWIKALPGKIAGVFAKLPGLLLGALKGIGHAITKPFTDAFDFVKKHIPHFHSHKILGVSVPLPFAEGGTVPRTTDVLVGEAGPEVLHLPAGTRVTPNHALPTMYAQTGTPTPMPGSAASATGARGAQNFTQTLRATQVAMTKLVQQSQQILAALNNMGKALQNTENELTNPRSGMVGALNAVETEFSQFSKASHNAAQAIQNDMTWLGNQMNAILPPQSKAAFDAMVTNFTATRASLQKVWTQVITDVNWGVGQIFKSMAGAFKTMGVNPPAGVAAATKGKARGGRLPGEPRGDHIPLYGSGGTLLGMADGGELVVNRHTEQRVNRMLPRGTSLGGEVAGETTPHFKSGSFAHGGRIPGYQTGGVVGQINSLASASGFNKTAIAGLLGNAMQESSLNPNTPGGGLWQQISNFGSGTGGSVQAQWARMLPQIMGIRGSMNNAGSPGAAATIFEQSFERAGIPALANRIRYANAAFSGSLGPLTGGAGAGGGVAPTIRAPGVKGPAGAITAMGQAAIAQIVNAANKAVQAAQPAIIGGGGGAGPTFVPTGGPVPPKVQAALQFANELATRHPPYGHQGAGWGLGAYDCSSYVSTVMDAAGIWPKWAYYTAAQPINQHTDPGPGQWITLGTWGSSGQQAHTMMEIDGHYFESGGGDGGPHRDSGWSQKFDQYRHPHGFALGGVVDNASAAKSKKNLFLRVNPGVGKAGYQPTQEEAAGIQANQQAIRTQFAKGHAMGGYLPVPWFAEGGDFIAKRPQIIGVGDRPGGERVTVQPAGQGRIGSPVHIEIHKVEVHRKGDIQKIVDEELAALASSLEAQL